MQAKLPPEEVQALGALAQALCAPGAAKGALMDAFIAARGGGVSRGTVYRRLRIYAGYRPERKPRSDRGKSRLETDALEFMASSMQQSVRANDKATKPIAVAMNVAAQNGFDVNVSEGTVARLLRQRQLDTRTQRSARNHLRLRSLFPNHVHEVDPSLCLIYYMGGKQRAIRDDEIYKNKPGAIGRIQKKVWRYTRYDHASRTIDVRYYEADGENQANLFDFLMYTWGRVDNRLSHGVPRIMLWDKGSANTGGGIKRLLDALGVQHIVHATHHAWAKGGVESANNIVETQFESRLRDEPVTSVEQLNAAAAAWARDYNANKIEHVDARVFCDDGQRRVRDDMWSLILQTPEQLVELPPRSVCAWFLTGAEHTRIVRDGRIRFAHPVSGKSELYDLQPWADQIYNGQKLEITPMLLGDCVLRVELPSADGAPHYIEVAPVREFDAFGRPMTGAVIGEEYKFAPQTAAEVATQRLAEVAYGAGTTREQAEELKRKNTQPFATLNDGRGAIAHSHLGAAALPHRIVPESRPLQTAALDMQRAAQAVPRTLTHFEACAWLASAGVAMDAERFGYVRQWYAQGVPETELPLLQQRLTARAGLRVIPGGQAVNG